MGSTTVTAKVLRIGVPVVSVVVALVAAFLAHGTVKPVAAASTRIYLDTAPTSAVQRSVIPLSGLIEHAELLGRIGTSRLEAERIAARAGVPADQLAATALTTANLPAAFKQPENEERANGIVTEGKPYRIEVGSRQTTPVLEIYTHAPTVGEADELADATVAELDVVLRALLESEPLDPDYLLDVRQLDRTRGGIVNGGQAYSVAALAFLVAFALAFLALRLLARLWLGDDGRTVPRQTDAGGNWPHTTRLMPWMLAVFLAMVWLVPFDAILLDVPAPIDLTLDRLVLPVLAAVVGLAWMIGGSLAPRLRPTPIHAAVGLFVLCAFASVVVNAKLLNQTLELPATIKRLPLLVSYASVFVIAATAVRGREVRAFLSFTLGLALVCAVGVLWEYRFKHNLFYEWSDSLLPSIFHVGAVNSADVDELGRRMVRGPAAVPLETVAMLAMALPIPLVRLTESRSWRQRVFYGIAVCLLFAGAFATFRKSALLAPLAAVAVVAIFRRRELLRLAPLGMILVLVIPVLAPGAVRLTTGQFEPGNLGAATVSDRASDYDAVRPDVWSHLLLGRGFGSYDHLTYRVLDSEVLDRLIETGVLGLIAFLGMAAVTIWAARPAIAERDRPWSALALSGAASAAAFAVASTLFDIMGFAHAVYIFLATAGFVAATIAHRREERQLLAPEPAPPPKLAIYDHEHLVDDPSRAVARV